MIKRIHCQNNCDCIIKEPHKQERVNNIVQRVIGIVKRAKVGCDVDIVEPYRIETYVYILRNKENKMEKLQRITQMSLNMESV